MLPCKFEILQIFSWPKFISFEMNKLENNFLSIYIQTELFNAFIWVILKSFGTKLIEIFFVDFKSSYCNSDVLGNFKSRWKKLSKMETWLIRFFKRCEVGATPEMLARAEKLHFRWIVEKSNIFLSENTYFLLKNKRNM